MSNGLSVGIVRWFKRHKRIVVAAIGIIGVGAATLGYMRFELHLRWLWLAQIHQRDMEDFVPIPDSPMPEIVVPDGWVRCRIGCLEFSLPRDLATNRIDFSEYGELATFYLGSTQVYVDGPMPATEKLLFSSSNVSEVLGDSECWTVPRIQLECYRADSSMFHWSMSRSEVRRYAFVMAMCHIIRSGNGQGSRVEYLHGDDIDATVLFTGKGRAALHWESRKENVWGTVSVTDSEEHLDSNLVRIVCQSMSVQQGQITNSTVIRQNFPWRLRGTRVKGRIESADKIGRE